MYILFQVQLYQEKNDIFKMARIYILLQRQSNFVWIFEKGIEYA